MRRHPLCGGGDGLTPLPRWRLDPVPDAAVVRQLADSLQVPRPLAALLVQRGHSTPEQARSFLRPELASLSPPDRLAGMNEAVAAISAVAASGGTILVHGDYDVDGQCATAVLVRTFRTAGVAVHGFVPNRMRDGYDFGPAGIAEARRVAADLIVTCDCGITANQAVADAKEAGFPVVVTDHHLPGETLPDALAVIDPQRSDDDSGLGTLSGTGVAFKLVQALQEPLDLPVNFPWHLLDLVALATIADVVPLTGENRTLVKHGLKLLPSSRWVGVRALLEVSGVTGERPRASQIGFTVAPRLNATGRIAEAADGLSLLLSDDEAEAKALAQRLERLNQERQQLDQVILEDALDEIQDRYTDPELHRAIVLAREEWHPGVIGIVASRVVERFGRPTFLIGLEGKSGRGSGRSVAGFDLHSALKECDDLLLRYGGHRMAAGLSIDTEQVTAFRERFNQVAAERLTVADLGPRQRVDLELTGDDLDDDLERLGRSLEPCGMGNPAPVFGLRKVRLDGLRTVGSNHLKTAIVTSRKPVDAIAFNWADRAADFATGDVDVAFRLERNEWQGRSRLQARVLALAPTDR